MERSFPAYRGDGPYVFVCYAHSDYEVVFPDLLWLQEQGLNFWYDEGISAGRIWRTEIAEAIRGAEKILFFVSSNSLQSDHCNREVNLSLDIGKQIIPVFLESVELTPDLQLGLNRIQALHVYEDSGHRDRLERSLRHEKALTDQVSFKRGSVSTSKPSVAVMPFVNLSNDRDQDYFGEGIAEDVLSELTRAKSLIVRPRSSSFTLRDDNADPKTVGRKLNATHVLEGSVRWSGNKVRVTVQLTEVTAEQTVWSKRYDREVKNIFEVQDEIAQGVLAALDSELLKSRSPKRFASTEAYKASKMGRYYLARYDLIEAAKWLETATIEDPLNADAWADRARTLSVAMYAGLAPNKADLLKQRQEYTTRALTINPDHVHALSIRAFMDTFCVDRNYQEAIDTSARLVAANPNHEAALLDLSVMLLAVGPTENYRQLASRAVQLSPLSRIALQAEFSCLLCRGLVTEARQAYAAFRKLGMKDDPESVAWFAIVDNDLDALTTLTESTKTADWYPFSAIWYSALIPYLSDDFSTAKTRAAPLKNTAGYQSYCDKLLIALIEREFDAAFEIYAQAIESSEFKAMILARNLIYHRLFPEFFKAPRFHEILRSYRMDDASLSSLRMPDLSF